MTFGLFPSDRHGRSWRQTVTAWSCVRGVGCAGSSLRRHRCACCSRVTSCPRARRATRRPLRSTTPHACCSRPTPSAARTRSQRTRTTGRSLALGCAPLLNDSDPDGDPLSVELVGQPAHGEAQVIENDPTTGSSTGPRRTTARQAATSRAATGSRTRSRIARSTVRRTPTRRTIESGSLRSTTRRASRPARAYRDPGRRRAGLDPWATDISPGPPNESNQHVSFEIMAPSSDKFVVPPSIDADGNLTFTPGNEPWLATVVVNAKDDGGSGLGNDTRVRQARRHERHRDHADRDLPAPQAPPVAVDDELTVAEDTPGHVSVIGNDTDINGDNLALTAVGAAGKGTATIDVPDRGRSTSALARRQRVGFVTYTVSDGHGGTDAGTVDVTITPVNDAPTAGDDIVVVAQGADRAPLSVLDNDDDVDGDTLAVSSASGAVHGSLDVTGDGLTYTPVAGYAGSDAFTYTVADGAGGHDTATVAVTVTPDAAPPVVGQLADALAGGTIGASTAPVRLSWHGTDAVSGVAALPAPAAGRRRRVEDGRARAPDVDIDHPVAGGRRGVPLPRPGEGRGRQLERLRRLGTDRAAAAAGGLGRDRLDGHVAPDRRRPLLRRPRAARDRACPPRDVQLQRPRDRLREPPFAGRRQGRGPHRRRPSSPPSTCRVPRATGGSPSTASSRRVARTRSRSDRSGTAGSTSTPSSSCPDPRPRGRQVVVPQDPGRDRPPGPPRLGELEHRGCVRPGIEAAHLRQGLGERDVVHRPRIRTAEDHEPVDRRGPGSDAGQRGQRRRRRRRRPVTPARRCPSSRPRPPTPAPAHSAPSGG